MLKLSYKHLGILIIITSLLMGSTVGVVGEKEELPDLEISYVDIARLTPDLHPFIGAYVENIGNETVDEIIFRTSKV